MDTTPADRRLRATFDEAPELYDRARPAYPEPLLDDVVELARLARGSRVVEVGCGTGQATAPLAARGLAMTCVELGAGLAAIARRKLPEVTVVNAAFETWEPDERDFDAVVAFTSWHWLDPAAAYWHAADLLHPGGALAIVATQHVLPPEGDQFFTEVQADYETVLPDDEKTKAGGPPPPERVRDLRAEIAASGRFEHVATRRHLWDVEYTADAYLDVLDTYSGHRVLDDTRRADLYDRIRRRIEARPRQRVRKTYLATLDVGRARRSPGAPVAKRTSAS